MIQAGFEHFYSVKIPRMLRITLWEPPKHTQEKSPHTLFAGRHRSSRDSAHSRSQIPGRTVFKMMLRSGPYSSSTAKGVQGI